MSRVITLFFVAVIYMSTASVCSAPVDAETQKILARLEKTWHIQEREIASAHILFRQAQGSSVNTTKRLTDKQIDEIISQTDFSVPANAFKELVSKLLNLQDDFITERELFWTPPKYLVKTRIIECNRKSDSMNLLYHTLLSDGKSKFIVDPLNTQVDVSLVDGVIDKIALLRSVPRLELSEGKFHFDVSGKQIRIGSDMPGWICHYLVDVDSGLDVNSFVHQTDSGLVGRGRYQRCFFSSGSIEFPRIAVQVEYVDHISTLTTITIIDEAFFNITIPDDVYRLALPKGMKIFDARTPGSRPEFIDLKEPTNDLASVVSPVAVQVADKHESSVVSIVLKYIFISLGVLLIVIAIIMKIFKPRC
ncbi:hypothetical protein FACS189419_02040 [Planctomycetales bacterium]|nr:hypothetical protein FACS189419_02040 [Planctomycetales bacterium]